ncbi:MAG: acetylglutamate kinase [Clostridiales bacterium]|jgi:acetylglutamate kinase|nr:acetylglutamate kinase [Clostridiales bacterium]
MDKTFLINKANIICEALPYINKLRAKVVVIKYGGNSMQDDGVMNTIMQDVAMLRIVGAYPILVHGGGPEINKMLDKLGIASRFHNGLRITDAATMEVVQMVMGGKINKDLTARLNNLGVKAIGLSGKDAKLIEVRKLPPTADGVDLGFVGEITAINAELLLQLCGEGYIPVIAGMGADESGQSYNINADTVAGEIAAAVKAEKLIFMTDVDGIRSDPADPASLISAVTVAQIRGMIARGEINGGMIPKVMGCVVGIERGIRRVHIINGTSAHPILLEIFTDTGIGTMVTA